MTFIDTLAEQKIRAAQERGLLDNLPGAGKPLELGNDALVPEHLRAGYRLLKNAGFLPPELEGLRDLRAAALQITRLHHPGERREACKRLQLLEVELMEARRRR